MHRARLALVLVPLLMSAALLATLVGTYVAVRGALETLVLGQGDAILDSLSNYPGDTLERGYVETMLAEQRPEGLRCIVVYDRQLQPREVVGDCLTLEPEELRSALLASYVVEQTAVDDRVRMVRGLSRDWTPDSGRSPGRDPVLIEFEPLMRRELEAGALSSLGIGGVASLAFVLVAVGLWRFSLREERMKATLERDRRLASLGEMAAVLAHEIRNPLTSMKGHAQLLAERLEPESKERSKADLVVSEAVRLEELTSDLLAFIRSESIDRRDVDPRDVAEASAADVGRDRVEIVASAAPSTWSLDPRLLQQALTNVLRNALEATEDDQQARLDLSVENGWMIYTVRDRGTGVPESDREKIFEPFYTTRVRGTGLGLPIALRIVTLHGGRITTVNDAEGGAVFQLLIPAG